MAGAMNVRQKLLRGRPMVGHTNVPPTVSITNIPSPPRYFEEDIPGFTAEAYDAETGDLSSQIVWSIPSESSPETTLVLGVGANVTLNFPYWGFVDLTVTVTDSYGEVATDTSNIQILN